MRTAKLLTMANWKMDKVYGKKRWIIFAAILVGCVPLAIFLGTYSAEESISSFFGRVAHAASCSSTYRDPEGDSRKIVFKYKFANRVFIAFRVDNTLTVDIHCPSQVLLAISLTVALVAFLQLSLVAIYVLKVYYRKPNPSGSTEVEVVEENLSTSSRFLLTIPYSHKHLVQAANNFTDEIGRGSFGVVYGGKLVHEGRPRPVAIKKMRWTHDRNVDKSFEDEIRRTGQLRHKNVLQLLGYSDFSTSGDLPLLMVTPLHSSLAKHLQADSTLPWLNWVARFKIAVGVAEGLAYAHDGVQQKLVHHDIKPGNILFDLDTSQAYIADFGSAKFMEPMHDEVETSNIAGTSGYMDPHFREYKIRTTKVDVYSFGVVLFVLVAGCAQIMDVSALVRVATSADVIDPDFSRPDASYNRDDVMRTLAIARLCTQYDPNPRPPMSQVVMMLRGDIPVSRFARDLSRAASSLATFAQATISKVKSFNIRAPNAAR